MSDWRIDPDTGDLDITSGSSTLVTDSEEIRQRLDIRLAITKGEYVFDRSVGTDWYGKILGEKDMVVIDAELRRAILTTTGIARLKDSIEYNRDAVTRNLKPKFVAILVSGEELPVEL